MKRYSLVFCVFFLVVLRPYGLLGQEGFTFPEGVTKDKIKFDLINNLILLPVEVNGVPLTFLLDSGSSSTVIFSFEEIDSIPLKKARKVSLRGLGKGAPVTAITSENNTMKIGKATKKDQTIFVVFEGGLYFSNRIGVPVHGIIGKDLLQDFVVEVFHTRKKLKMTLPESFTYKNCRKCLDLPLDMENGKPHLTATVENDEKEKELRFLLDSGSGDALWLFENEARGIDPPKKYFDDYLGLGINGDIYGKRSKMSAFRIGDFRFVEVNTAYPDSDFIADTNVFANRDGSIGGEILKRFNYILNYSDKTIRLKRNRFFKRPFYYNMSGLTLEHGGLAVMKERKPGRTTNNENETSRYNPLMSGTGVFELSLAQVYEVVEVRNGSPAGNAGIRVGDEILYVNNKAAYQYELHEINALFYSREGRTIRMTLQRDGVEFKTKFKLQDAL